MVLHMNDYVFCVFAKPSISLRLVKKTILILMEIVSITSYSYME